MTKFEQWCESKGYPVEAGIHTHVLSSWADEFARSETERLIRSLSRFYPRGGSASLQMDDYEDEFYWEDMNASKGQGFGIGKQSLFEYIGFNIKE